MVAHSIYTLLHGISGAHAADDFPWEITEEEHHSARHTPPHAVTVRVPVRRMSRELEPTMTV